MDINLSGQGLLIGNTLEQLEETLQRFDLPASQIGIELTEHTLIEAPEEVIKRLDRLREAGCTVSLDDFGTGYSALTHLQRFPVDVIKIDRSFIRDIPEDQEDAAIVSAIVAMGHSLDLRVVAEGVETAEQSAYLRSTGCDEAQGFLFGRPVPSDELHVLLLYTPTLSPS